jgi:hypothetical protein
LTTTATTTTTVQRQRRFEEWCEIKVGKKSATIMDLLGAYDSNSDSDDDREGNVKYEQNNKPTAPNSSEREMKGVQADFKSPATLKLPPKKPSTSSANDKKRGKKILKLAAILPEHIWNQLTAGTIGDGESDNEEDDNNTTKEDMAVQAAKTKTTLSKFDQCDRFSRPGRRTISTKDSDLQKLLQDLPKSKSSSSGKAVSILGDSQSDSAHDGWRDDENFTSQQDKTESTNYQRTPEDIYASKIPSSTPPQSSDKKTLSLTSTVLSTQQQYLPKPAASRTVPLRAAAPFPIHWTGTTSSSTSNVPSNSTPNIHHNNQSAKSSSEIDSTVGGGKKKMSRKRQMEQMLRAGKIHQFQGDYELEGTANVYQHSEYDSTMSTYQVHGVHMVPTSSYNVSAGTTVASTEISGRQRNKHQLNSLLANAASLEARRMQNPHLANAASGSSGATHRASAKRKYGW